MRVLVELGAGMEAKAVQGGTPLHLAASQGRLEAMQGACTLVEQKPQAHQMCKQKFAWKIKPSRIGRQAKPQALRGAMCSDNKMASLLSDSNSVSVSVPGVRMFGSCPIDSQHLHSVWQLTG